MKNLLTKTLLISLLLSVTIASGVQVDLCLSPTEIVAMTQSLTKAAVMAREVTNVAKAVARAKEIVAVAEPGPLITTEGEVKVMIGLVLAGLVVLKIIIGDSLNPRWNP